MANKKQHLRDGEDPLAGFLRILMPIEDVSLAILKAHIMAEAGLREYIKHFAPRPHEKLRELKWSQLRTLAATLTPPDPKEDWLWEGLRHLNNCRNAIAHHIEPNDSIPDTSALITWARRSDWWESICKSGGEANLDTKLALTIIAFGPTHRIQIHRAVGAKLRIPREQGP